MRYYVIVEQIYSSEGKEKVEVFCRKCGAEIPEGGSFCGRCGTPIGKKTVAEGEGQGKNPEMAEKGKNRKPLVIGVCSGLLLLAVGTAILFAAGVFGGKDEAKETVAETEELKEAEKVKEPKQKGLTQEQEEQEQEEQEQEEQEQEEQKQEEPQGMASRSCLSMQALI